MWHRWGRSKVRSPWWHSYGDMICMNWGRQIGMAGCCSRKSRLAAIDEKDQRKTQMTTQTSEPSGGYWRDRKPIQENGDGKQGIVCSARRPLMGRRVHGGGKGVNRMLWLPLNAEMPFRSFSLEVLPILVAIIDIDVFRRRKEDTQETTVKMANFDKISCNTRFLSDHPLSPSSPASPRRIFLEPFMQNRWLEATQRGDLLSLNDTIMPVIFVPHKNSPTQMCYCWGQLSQLGKE